MSHQLTWSVLSRPITVMNFTTKYRLILIKFYVTLIPSVTVEICWFATKL